MDSNQCDQKMAFPRLLQILAVLSLYIKLIQGDCTSCPSIPVECDVTNVGVVNGILTQTFTTDVSGCKVVTFRCTDDANNGENSFMIDYDSVSSSKISLFEPLFRIFLSKMDRV